MSESGYLESAEAIWTTEAVQMFGVPGRSFVRDVDEGDAAEEPAFRKVM